MQGTIQFNENSKRYFIKSGDSKVKEITSGDIIKVYYRDLEFHSRIEHNGRDYYMVLYPDIELISIVSSRAEVC